MKKCIMGALISQSIFINFKFLLVSDLKKKFPSLKSKSKTGNKFTIYLVNELLRLLKSDREQEDDVVDPRYDAVGLESNRIASQFNYYRFYV